MPTTETGALVLRPGRPEDAEACGRICFGAFREVADRHGFPPEHPSAEAAVAVVADLLANPGFHGVVAELDGRVVGSVFLDERQPIAGIGPITVDPAAQDAGVGRSLMGAVLERARERRHPGVRLLQTAYNVRSLALYVELGFQVREPIVALQGAPLGEVVPGLRVRPAVLGDVEACDGLCAAVHGHDRSGTLLDAVGRGSARVVERDGRITGYTTGVGFRGHSVGESNGDLQALIAAAEGFAGPGFLLPARNHELFRWCLDRGLRVVQPMTLMTIGLYEEPAGAYLPSILY